MIQKRIKTKIFDKYKIKYLSKVYLRLPGVPEAKGASPLPATFTLVASNTKWYDVVEVMTLIVINPVNGKV